MAWHSSITSASDTGSSDSDSLPGLDQREIEDLVDQLQQVPAGLRIWSMLSLLRASAAAVRIPSAARSRGSR